MKAKKVATDLFITQMKWTLWYIPILLVVYLLLYLFTPEMQAENWNLMSVIYQPTKIYMLVIGLLTIMAFLTYYVKNGITRKDYFVGSSIAATGVAFSIMIISAILAGILALIGSFTTFDPGTSQMDFLNTTSVWLMPVLVYSLIILCYYIAGWMVISGYYRFGGWGLLGFIGIGVLYISAVDLLWENDWTLPLMRFSNIPMPVLSLSVSLVCTLLLIAVGLWVVRLTTKRMPVKPE
ncbi:hypothetical protein EPH95_14710 [Salicibibacter halophilus]|uniref:Uncharacterized protein n=1 Tax=Salicibibacter halophilus TaxID=2502791 RepID=A0A514LKF0_9BACI|nr:hypothetical protein [Salicibibacter halophilus]QDI92283.1 hypothetical protein EPH95_14710 [Salicibibacter halophilus]